MHCVRHCVISLSHHGNLVNVLSVTDEKVGLREGKLLAQDFMLARTVTKAGVRN
jgi:hypothetical protein